MAKGKVTHRTTFRFAVLVSVTDLVENLHCAWRGHKRVHRPVDNAVDITVDKAVDNSVGN
jgi:hypothetical protein